MSDHTPAVNVRGLQMARDEKEKALWVSCPKCDARPGDACEHNPLVAEVFDFADAAAFRAFRLHYARVDMMKLLASMEDDD